MNKKIFGVMAAAVLLFACNKKNDVTPTPPKTDSATGVYILTEGAFNGNSAGLSFYDVKTKQVSLNLFASVNQRALGDVANDIAIYGGKMYIVVNNSNNIEIMDAHTVKSLGTIHVDNLQPRHIAFANGKAYVTSFSGKLLVIDTLTNQVATTATTRTGAEGIAILNNKVYIGVPGVWPASNQTILSILDLNTLTEQKTLTVGPNPNQLAADQYNHLYAVCAGDYDKIPASLATIDLQTDQVLKNDTTVKADNMAIYNNRAYLYKSTYNDDSKQPVMMYDVQNGKLLSDNFITDGTTVGYFYGISTDAATGDVYVTDALSFGSSKAKVTCFGSNGKTKFTIALNDYASFASKVIFLR